MIQKVVKRSNLNKFSEVKDNLAYWLSKTSEMRVAAIELLRRQQDGSSARLQRSARIVQRTKI